MYRNCTWTHACRMYIQLERLGTLIPPGEQEKGRTHKHTEYMYFSLINYLSVMEGGVCASLVSLWCSSSLSPVEPLCLSELCSLPVPSPAPNTTTQPQLDSTCVCVCVFVCFVCHSLSPSALNSVGCSFPPL